MDRAIIQILEKFLVEFPTIELQTVEDRVLSKFLKKNSFLTFGRNLSYIEEITIPHIIAFMERNEAIYKRNADFVLKVQQEVKRTKNIYSYR